MALLAPLAVEMPRLCSCCILITWLPLLARLHLVWSILLIRKCDDKADNAGRMPRMSSVRLGWRLRQPFRIWAVGGPTIAPA